MQQMLYVLIAGVFAVWAFCAGLWPLIEHDFDFSSAQDVWDRWQAWNTGVIALLSALTALAVARLRDEKERQRSFIAAKALLPDHLSSLLEYLRATQAFLTVAYSKVAHENMELPEVPSRPIGYEQWVSDAIRWGDPAFVSYMSNVVSHLQVYKSRTSALQIEFDDPESIVSEDNIKEYLVQGAIIYMHVGKLLNYVRDNKSLSNNICAEEIESGLNLCGIHFHEDYGIDQALRERRAETESKRMRRRRMGLPKAEKYK